MAMDGRYAENAGAFFGRCLDGPTGLKRRSIFRFPEMQEHFLVVPGKYAGRSKDSPRRHKGHGGKSDQKLVRMRGLSASRVVRFSCCALLRVLRAFVVNLGSSLSLNYRQSI